MFEKPNLWRYPRFVILFVLGAISLVALIGSIWTAPDLGVFDRVGATSLTALFFTVLYFLVTSD